MHFDFDYYSGMKFFEMMILVFRSTFTETTYVFLAAYAIPVLYYLIFGNKKERIFWILPIPILIATCLNPWAAAWLTDHLPAIQTRYFRLYWLLPFFATYAYFIADLFFRKGKVRALRIVLGLALTGVIVWYGGMELVAKTADLHNGGLPNPVLNPVENIYKIDQNVLDADTIIRADLGDDFEESGYIDVVMDHTMLMDLRTYDGAIRSCIRYSGDLGYGTVVFQEMLDAGWEDSYAEYIGLALNVLDVEEQPDVTIDAVKLERALRKRNAQYIIVAKNHRYPELWDSCAEEIGQTDRYRVLRFHDVAP